MEIYLSGAQADLDGLYNSSELGDAVYRSLFSWAIGQTSDETQSFRKDGGHCGWWGDYLASDKTDEYGSRLWMFLRSKITDTTVQEIEQVAREALQWLITDKVASSVDVLVERDSTDTQRVNLAITIYKGNSSILNLQFKDLWNGVL